MGHRIVTMVHWVARYPAPCWLPSLSRHQDAVDLLFSEMRTLLPIEMGAADQQLARLRVGDRIMDSGLMLQEVLHFGLLAAWLAGRLAGSSQALRGVVDTWRASIVVDWNQRSCLKFWVTSQTKFWKGTL